MNLPNEDTDHNKNGLCSNPSPLCPKLKRKCFAFSYILTCQPTFYTYPRTKKLLATLWWAKMTHLLIQQFQL